jgi:hypothetical protein
LLLLRAPPAPPPARHSEDGCAVKVVTELLGILRDGRRARARGGAAARSERGGGGCGSWVPCHLATWPPLPRHPWPGTWLAGAGTPPQAPKARPPAPVPAPGAGPPTSVALLMSSLRSGLKRAMSLTRPNSTSVCRVRSWASSIIITLQAGRQGRRAGCGRDQEPRAQGMLRHCRGSPPCANLTPPPPHTHLYDARSGSPRNSRSSMPSVMYLISVLSLVQSSKRML